MDGWGAGRHGRRLSEGVDDTARTRVHVRERARPRDPPRARTREPLLGLAAPGRAVDVPRALLRHAADAPPVRPSRSAGHAARGRPSRTSGHATARSPVRSGPPSTRGAGTARSPVTSPDPGHRSHAVTTIRTAAGDAGRLREWCEREAGVTLGVGLSPGTASATSADALFRIGHMGHLNPPMLLGTLATVGHRAEGTRHRPRRRRARCGGDGARRGMSGSLNRAR